MADEESKEDLAMNAMHYAHGKALEAVKDMPPSNLRLLTFRLVWVEAVKEYINGHKS